MKLRVRQKILGARLFFACILLIYLIQILAIDMYAPALPAMQDSFAVSELYLNNTVFAFLIASTAAMALAGPISDRFGRKPVLVASSVLFCAGSVACALAPSVEVLVCARVIESLGCGSVATLSGAMIKDAYEGDDLTFAMTILQSLIIIGPVLAPFLGSLAMLYVGWRGIFWMLSAGGAVAVVLSFLVSETYDASHRAGNDLGSSLAQMGRDVKHLVSKKGFTLLALFIGVTGVPFFAFIAVSPYILMEGFGLDYLGYSLVYACACSVNAAAPFVYMRLSKRWASTTVLRFVVALLILAAALMIAIGFIHPATMLVAFAAYALAEGIARPAAFLILLDQPPDKVGAASSLGNFTYGVITSFATIAATFPWPSFLLGLTALMALTAGIVAVLYVSGSRFWAT